jgi:hypothetical protein
MSLDRLKKATEIVAEIEKLDDELLRLQSHAQEVILCAEDSVRISCSYYAEEAEAEVEPTINSTVDCGSPFWASAHRLAAELKRVGSCSRKAEDQVSIHTAAAIFDLIAADKKVKRDGLIRALESLGFKI